MSPDELETKLEEEAKQHARTCGRCMATFVLYRYRIHRPWSTVPAAVASDVRARLCADGRKIVDRLLGVPS